MFLKNDIVSDAKYTFGSFLPQQEGVCRMCGSLMETIRDFISNIKKKQKKF